MNLKACIALLLFVTITVIAVSTSFAGFIDAVSAMFVVGGAICFGICAHGEWYSDVRLNAFSEGAVLSGWIGALLGAVIIAGNVEDLNALGPALAVMLLTVVYGYFIKALVRIVLISRSKE
jgi:flagellar motor component MotA